MATFRLVQNIDGKWLINDFTDENVIPAMEIRDFTFDRLQPPRGPLRKELVGQPMFKGVIGPMWGGEENGQPVIRYEDQKAYDKLSI